jgi:2-oxoglutarate ferredoxin oxidoreductase subunit gamma
MGLKRILIAGEGGQGIQALAHLLTSSAYESNLSVSYLPNFGVEQRGGVSLAYVQISDSDISFPKFAKADLVVLFAPRAVKRIEEYLKRDTVILFDNSLVDESLIDHLKVPKIAIPASRLASQKLIPRVFNIILLGALVAELGSVKLKKVEKEIEKFFAEKIKKEPQLKHFNVAALRLGYNIIGDLMKDVKWREKILKK